MFSEDAKRFTCDNYSTLPEKIVVIPHGVPEIPFIEPQDSIIRKQMNSQLVFVSAGHFRETKGIDLALRALGKLKKQCIDFKYLVIGSNHPRNINAKSYRVQITELVKHLNLEDNIIFIDEYLPLAALISYIQASDIALVPYTSKDQSSSGILSLLMACGRPIICSDFQYAKTVVDDENGIIVETNDMESFYFAIETLINNLENRGRMMKANFKKTQDWQWDKVAIKYYEGIRNFI